MRRRRKRMSATEKKAAELFRRAVVRKGSCVMGKGADPCDGTLDAHHVIAKQFLNAHTSTLDEQQRIEIVWDPRNGVPVCRRHHGLLTNAMRRLPFTPGEAYEFARDHDIVWRLDREINPGRLQEMSGDQRTGDTDG